VSYQLGNFPKIIIDDFCEKNNLSRQENIILTLRFCEGLEHKQIARIMRAKIDAHYQRLGKIYKQLKVSGQHKGKEAELLSILQKEGIAWNQMNRLEYILDKITAALGPEAQTIPHNHDDEKLDKSDRHISKIQKKLLSSDLPRSEQSKLVGLCIEAVLNEIAVLSPQNMDRLKNGRC
jgi:hypothetical protein